MPRDTCVQFVTGSHLWPQWFLPRKFATEMNYPLKDTHDEKLSEERQYHEVPVQQIEAGKWPILQWECKVTSSECSLCFVSMMYIIRNDGCACVHVCGEVTECGVISLFTGVRW